MGLKDKQKETAHRLGLTEEQIPRSIAIIMDGNGRWAQQRAVERAAGHYEGAKTAEKIALGCVERGIECLTLYSFSVENWKRPKEEVSALMGLYEEYLVSMRPMLKRENVRMIHLGRKSDLPGSVLTELATTIDETQDNDGMTLALALNYGGRSELVDATKAIAMACRNGSLNLEDIDEQCISEHLYTASVADPDLVIRTANELRISNFLLWQISYSEFHVTDTFWPDFDEADLDKAFMSYAQRDRRFGALSSA